MRQHPYKARFVFRAWLVLLATFHSSPGFADVEPELERARVALTERNAGLAIEILESSLTGGTAEDRRRLLESLRAAYPVAIQQAEALGDTRKAKSFRENLQILEHARSTQAGESATPAKPSQTPVVPAPTSSPTDSPSTTPPASEPRRPDDPFAGLFDLNANRASASAGADPGERQLANPEPVVPASAAAVPESPKSSNDLDSADLAFRSGRYEEAGRIYGGLAAEQRLPTSRNEHWAYCRCVAVVGEINAAPSTTEQWAAIHTEIRAIRALAPKNWFGEYLRRLAAERSAGKRAPATPSAYLVRAADPSIVETSAQRPRGAVSARNDTAEAPTRQPIGWSSAKPTEASTASAFARWQVRETSNFRIFHTDQALAESLAVTAEAARDQVFARWSGESPQASWAPRCDIYVYPTSAIFSERTGQPESSPGFSTMGLNGGRVVARRINLRADADRIVEAVLPHEVSHVVQADLFPRVRIPRWADEGLATLSEPDADQVGRARKLGEALSSGQLFRLQTLMRTDYPDARYWDLFRDQSISLTRFLFELGTSEKLIEFLRASQSSGYESELSRLYGINGFTDLENRWLEFARAQAASRDERIRVAGALKTDAP